MSFKSVRSAIWWWIRWLVCSSVCSSFSDQSVHQSVCQSFGHFVGQSVSVFVSVFVSVLTCLITSVRCTNLFFTTLSTSGSPLIIGWPSFVFNASWTFLWQHTSTSGWHGSFTQPVIIVSTTEDYSLNVLWRALTFTLCSLYKMKRFLLFAVLLTVFYHVVF